MAGLVNRCRRNTGRTDRVPRRDWEPRMPPTIAVTSPFAHPLNSFAIVRDRVAKALAGHYRVTDTADDCDLQIHVGAPDPTQRDLYAHGRNPVAFFSFVEALAIPPGWVDTLNDADAVIVPSRFCLDVLRASGVHRPLWRVPLGLDLDDEPELGPDMRATTFTIMWQGGRLHGHGFTGEIDGDRKCGPLVERAFHEAAIPGARLILKAGPNGGPERDERSGEVWRIERAMSPAEIAELDQEVDLFVWPTRGEGFGLVPLEKLSRGIPVRVTGWSGPLEYLRDFEESQIEDFTMVDTIYHGVVTKMADVPVGALAELLRSAHANRHVLRRRREQIAATARSRWDFRAVMVTPLLDCVGSLLR